MKAKAKKIVVTGVAGFIGFHLARALLARGVRVVGIDNLNDYYDPRIKRKRLSMLRESKHFSFHKLDLTSYPKLEALLKKEKPDEIVHLAAQAGVRYSLTNPRAYLAANELGTLNVFEAARHLRLPRVLYASSSSVYGKNAKSPMHEDDPTDTQISVYGATKKSNELLAHVYTHLFGIETIGLRFFTVYGTWGRPDLALFKFTKNILAGTSIDLYNHGNMKRSFTHVSDVVAGVIALLAVKPSGRTQVYNLGGAEAVPLKRFVELIEAETGKRAKKRLLPLQPGDVPETVADTSKAKRDVGYVPRTTIEEGVKEFVAWFTANQNFLSSLSNPKQ